MNTKRWPPAARMTASAFLCVAFFTAAARAEVSITPRVALYFDNQVQRQSAIDYNTPQHDAYLAQVNASLAQVNALVLQLNALTGPPGIPVATLSTDRIDSAQRGKQISFPQFGGTITFGVGASETTQIALTALYGTTDNTATQISSEYFRFNAFNINVIDSDVGTVRSQAEQNRLDIEATLQHRLNETFSLIGGVRAERTALDIESNFTGTRSANFFNLYYLNLNAYVTQFGLPPVAQPYYVPALLPVEWQQQIDIWTYSARIGAAAYAPVGDRHLFYVNGLLQLSHTAKSKFTRRYSNGATEPAELPAETSTGPDISVGYMYRLSDRFGFDVRYRATVYFPVSGPSDFDDARVNHGIGLGFTTWFGDR